MSIASDAYFEARLAFIDRPEARINTEDTEDAVVVMVRERIDNEKLGMTYVARDLLGMRWLAQKARAEWRHAMDAREESEPFDLKRLEDHVFAHAIPWLPLCVRVNDAWDGERMALQPTEVTVSAKGFFAIYKHGHAVEALRSRYGWEAVL